MSEKHKEFLSTPSMLPSSTVCRTCRTLQRTWEIVTLGSVIAISGMFLAFFATGGRFVYIRSEPVVVILIIALSVSLIINILILGLQYLHRTCWQTLS